MATVSRYINQSPTLTDEFKVKVEAAIQELHYVPNTAAKSLKTGSSATIALIVPELSNPFYTDIYNATRKYALDAGLHTALFSVAEEEHMFAELEQQLLSGYYAGAVIVLLDNPVFLEYVERFATSLPTVLISTENHARICNCIMIDTFDAEYRATKYLIEKGRKRIALINGNMNRQTSRDKLNGYKKCLADSGLPMDETLIYDGHYASADGYYAARQFMMLANAPDAMVCANDILAIGCLKYLYQAGVKVPEEVAVVGMDGTAWASNFIPSITTMEIPIEDICKEATSMLLKKINHAKAPNQVRIFQTTLVVNNSTDKDAPMRFDL